MVAYCKYFWLYQNSDNSVNIQPYYVDMQKNKNKIRFSENLKNYH